MFVMWSTKTKVTKPSNETAPKHSKEDPDAS